MSFTLKFVLANFRVGCYETFPGKKKLKFHNKLQHLLSASSNFDITKLQTKG